MFCVTSAVFMYGLCFIYVPIPAESDVCNSNFRFFLVLSVLSVKFYQLSDGV